MRWYSARVADNDDRDRRLRLRLEIPELFGDAVHEAWVEPLRVPGWWHVPPIDAVVVVLREDGGRLLWAHQATGARSEAPEELRSGYPGRAGLYSPEEEARVVLDDAGVAYLLAGEVRVASSTTAAVQAMVLGDDFLRDYATFRSAIGAFMFSSQTATTAPQIAGYAVTAHGLIASIKDTPADNYKAQVGRVE